MNLFALKTFHSHHSFSVYIWGPAIGKCTKRFSEKLRKFHKYFVVKTDLIAFEVAYLSGVCVWILFVEFCDNSLYKRIDDSLASNI